MKFIRIMTGKISILAALVSLFASGVSAQTAAKLDSLWTVRDIVGLRTEAAAAKKKGLPEASLYLGRIAMTDFDFPTAQTNFGEYRRLMKRAKKSPAEITAILEDGCEEGNTQMERLQKITVIDAVTVDKNRFLQSLRLPLSAGRVVSVSELPLPRGNERGHTGYISESGDLYMWSEANDSTGLLTIREASRLNDGKLGEAREAPDFLGQDGDAQYPFLSADGATLYFAANGDNSIGGYDIFLASRDASTGEYMQPVNAGIPFNSAADDYMLAIDEENGVGWWATDRHYLPDNKIVLYVYVLPESREDINVEETDDDELRARALLNDIKITWTDEEAEANERLAEEIRKIQPGQKPKRKDCRIPLRGGGYIYSVDDVKTQAQKNIVKQYIALDKEASKSFEKLDAMRREYAERPGAQLGKRIAEAEKDCERRRAEVTSLLSELYRLLGYK